MILSTGNSMADPLDRQRPATVGGTGQPTLMFDGVSHAFGEVQVLDQINLTVEHGSFVALVGPSGCGKTTLLNLAAGLARPDTGAVYYQGRKILEPNTRAGYLTQDDALLPWRDVVGNVALPLEIKGIGRAARFASAREIIKKVGLHRFEHHRPSQLSGGMRKRVSLARTLIYKPETLLLDEPFGALDAQTRMLMQKQLLDLCREFQLTVILVTHDIGEAIALADRIVVLSARPARVIEIIDVPHPEEGNVFRRERGNEELYLRIWDQLAAQAADTGST
jgi:NitT/TauT family transport system ATP-binding protein